MIMTVGGKLEVNTELMVLNGAQITSNTLDANDENILLRGVGADGSPSMISTGSLHIENSIRVENGAMLTSDDVFHTSSVVVDGPGSTWSINGTSVWGGDMNLSNDISIIFIDDNAHVSNGTTFIANASGNQTLVALDFIASAQNASSSWTSSGDVFLGGDQSNSRGQGTIDMGRNSRLEIAGMLKIWDDSEVLMGGNSTLVADSVDNSAGGVFQFSSGSLQVNQFVGDLETQNGILDPGGPEAGSTSILGTFTHGEDSTLAIDIGGTMQGGTYDVVSGGLALLQGELNVALINGFVPGPTDEFTVLLSSNIVGELANAPSGQRLQTAGGSGSFIVNYGIGSPFDASRIVLSDFEAGGFVLGDINGDGSVDLLDVTPFVDAVTAGTNNPAADINQDGAVDLLDVAPFVALLIG